MDDEIYITVSFDPDGDEPVADLVYRGSQWASLTRGEGELILSVYSEREDPGAPSQLPLAAALTSIHEARARLEKLG